MHVLRGSFERYDEKTNEELMRQSTYVWPHAFARMDAGADEILSRYGSNHIHAIPGAQSDLQAPGRGLRRVRERLAWASYSLTWTSTRQISITRVDGIISRAWWKMEMKEWLERGARVDGLSR